MAEQIVEQIHYLEDSDDEAFLSELLLEKQKVAVHLNHHSNFGNLQKTLLKAKEDELMLILVDLNMPVIKGTDVITRTLESNSGDNIIIGICSGSEDPADKRNALEAGAHFFVNKPLDLRSLAEVCDACEVLSLKLKENGETNIIWAA